MAGIKSVEVQGKSVDMVEAINQINYPSHDYLDYLLDVVNEKRKNFKYCEIDVNACAATYLSNRRLEFDDKKNGFEKILYAEI